MKKKLRIGYIYLLLCLVNGKGYVGQTIRKPARRWYGHIKSAFKHNDQRPLYRSMRNHGLKNFTAEVVWSGPESELNAAEKRFVRKFKTFIDTRWGYNLTTGGDHHKLSAASRRKLSASVRASFADGTRAKSISTFMTEYYSTPAQRKELSTMMEQDWQRPDAHSRHSLSKASLKRRTEKVKATWTDKDLRARHSELLKAQYAADPTRVIQLSKSLKAANKRDPSIAERRGKKLRGNKRTAACVEVIASNTKAQWADEEKRAQLVVSLRRGAKKRWARQEEHDKSSAAHRSAWKAGRSTSVWAGRSKAQTAAHIEATRNGVKAREERRRKELV